ncbi:MAG TPA: putative LPS assembly protein LptD, partial [Bacteroidota bacterium]
GYNFRTKKGKIALADTEIEQGYYHGEEIKKVDTNVLFVADGRYTTCNADHPHYYFFSPKMKVMVRDKVVAEPIYLYIADIPVFWLPFGVFPNKAGRRSGIIAPAYGQDLRRGHYLSHFGYYWAISDYFDLTTTFDWFARGGWLNRSSLRYAKRYDFTGSINASMTRTHEGEPGDPDRVEQRDYNISVYHNQQINPTARFDVNFTFTSGTYYRNFSANQNEILRQNVVSTATFSKSWEGTNRSISLSAYRDQNLQTGAVEERLPSISFQQGQFFPFRRSAKSRGLSGASGEYAWYEQIGLSYNGQGQSNRSKQVDIIQSRISPGLDSTRNETRRDRLGVNHQLSLNIAPKLGYVTVSPFMSYNEKWYTKRIERDSTGTRDVNGFNAVRTYSTGVSASTRFYGILQPQVFGITGIRHTVAPSMTFSYQPDFSDPRFGYYGSYQDTAGRAVKYSFYEREIYGGAPSGRQQSLNFSVGNLFEMKYQPADTARKEEKIQLLNAGANIAYNFVADSLGLSPLSISYRTDIGRYLNISASTTYDFYVFDETVGARVNRFNISEKSYLADLTNFSLSLSTSLSGEKSTTSAQQPQTSQQQQPALGGQASGFPGQQQQPGYGGLYGTETPDFSIPWNLSLTYNFSQSQNDPRRKFRSSSVNANLSFNLTEKWRFTATGSYDFIQKQFAAPSIQIYRDLHCWEMNFSWYPIGFYSGYRLELRVKAPQLQDLKVTKQSSARGTYY